MTLVITDSTILIMLVKVDLIEQLLEYYKEVLIPEEVFNEIVIQGKINKKEDAIYLEKRIEEEKIRVIKIKDEYHKQKLKTDFNIHDGEAECIVLFFEINASLLGTDDNKTRNVCKIFKIPNFSCLSFVLFCIEIGILSKEQGLIKIGKISDVGWYKKNIIEEIKKKIMEVK